MKKIRLFLLTALLAIAGNIHAQHHGLGKGMEMNAEKYQKIMNKKMRFMKENLNLTPQESKEFEKTYRDYIRKKMQIRRRMRNQFRKKIQNGQYQQMSDSQVKALVNLKLELEEEKMQLELQFQKELQKILPPKKLIAYYKTERAFNKKMMARMKMNRKNKKAKK